MQLLLAKPLTEKIFAQLRLRVNEVTKMGGRKPKLAVIIVGDDPASSIYVQKKGEAAHSIGILSETLRFNKDADPSEVFAKIAILNQDPTVDGILIQRPLPAAFQEKDVIYWVDPSKDVDAFHPLNVGKLALGQPCLKPCTPAGVIALLDHYKIEIAGKTVCVIGRSSIVGKPMATLLLQRDATLIQCHSRTQGLANLTRHADVIVVAAGKPKLLNVSHVKKGAVIIDVGIHKGSDGKLVGDVDFDSVQNIASAITPVPGGVGPMTIAMLLQNTLDAAESRSS